MRVVIRSLAWIAIIALAAALPWLTRDLVETSKQEHESAPGSAPSATATVETKDEPEVPEVASEKPQAAKEESEEKPDIEAPGELEPDAPAATRPKQSLGAKVSQFFQQTWLKVAGSEDANTSGSMHSDRSREVAKRIGPKLIAELDEKNLTAGQPIFIRIFKETDELELWMQPEKDGNFVLFKTYPICAWSGELGPKLEEGDGQSPEGFYFVPPDRMNPQSRFHLSFDIGFPNDYDRHYERTGSYLMVHGSCVSIGCYAMTDPGIEEIYTLAIAALENGQPFFRVHAFPFRMTDEKMDTLKEDSQWFDFWANLKEGYDYFEFVGRPPDVSIVDGRYHYQ